jgi:hypothetical protein
VHFYGAAFFLEKEGDMGLIRTAGPKCEVNNGGSAAAADLFLSGPHASAGPAS